MRAEEVVVVGKENDKRQGAVIGFKAAGRAHMEFEGSVKTFDELFEGSVSFRFLVEVLQADDRVMFNAG